MNKLFLARRLVGISMALLLVPLAASAQQDNPRLPTSESREIGTVSLQQSNVPTEVRQAEDTVERAARRFRLGVEAGVGLDPELLMFGGHAAFGPLFNRNVEVRPGIE